MNEAKFASALLEPEIKKSPSPVEFQDLHQGKHRVIHPEIASSTDGIMHETGTVEISSMGQIKILTFGDYLGRIGVSYADYYRLTKSEPNKDKNEVLRTLHQEAINKRTRVAIRKHQEYAREIANRDNLQQTTAKEHSPVFLKTINDLGIDGLGAELVPEQLDYLDGIDEMLTLDPESLQSGGEKSGSVIRFGIQRSFKDKKKEVMSDPIRFIPEKPEIGVLFRIFIKENLSDYIDEKTGESIWQKLLDIRTAKARASGVDPNEFSRVQRNQGLSSVDKVLSGGVREQIRRVKNILQNVQEQLQAYIDSPDFKKQSKAVQEQLRSGLENMKIEDFLLALDDLKN
jgi:hypothetical protein